MNAAFKKPLRAIAGCIVNALCALFGKERVRGRLLREAAALLEPEERFLIPSLEKGAGPEKNRFAYQRQYVDFGFAAGEKILDIGFGADPFPYATHLADLYEGETSHRTGALAKDSRPFQACDIEKLPYNDKEFDFVYCSHVLEHVRDPAKACREIMRVGRRGYIETPTRTSDIMLNFTKLEGHHQWHVVMAGSALVFFRWADRERRDTGCNDYFKMLHSGYKTPFQDLMRRNRDMFANMLSWENEFSYYVFDHRGELTASHSAAKGEPHGV